MGKTDLRAAASACEGCCYRWLRGTGNKAPNRVPGAPKRSHAGVVNGYPVGASLLPPLFGGVPGLFALVALAAARCEAIDPAPGADTVIATAALATVGGLEQGLRPSLVAKPQHSGTGLLRSTDRAVVAEEGIAITPGDPALAPGTRLIGGKGRSAQDQQQDRDTGAK